MSVGVLGKLAFEVARNFALNGGLTATACKHSDCAAMVTGGGLADTAMADSRGCD